MADPTICATCYYAPANARYTPWYTWMCGHDSAKLEAVFIPVTGQTVADPPRRKCKDLNYGQCPNWKEGQNVMGLKVSAQRVTSYQPTEGEQL